MKNLLASLFLLFSTPAAAGVSCSLPFNLVNGTIADATQVMANYNALVTCLGSAAAAGANNDITSLSGLTTPIPPNLGGTAAFTATAASTGSANAQIVATTTPTFPALSSNIVKVVFAAGFTNTGPTTLNVNATGVKNIFRRTTDGIQALVGGEIISGVVTEVLYDGTQYQLTSNVSPFPVGTVLTTIAAAADAGFLLMQGQCLSTTTFAALFAKMGNPAFQAPCVAGQFNMPDGRGRVVAGFDAGNSQGRLSFSGTINSGTGGLELLTLGAGQIPQMTTASSGAHTHSVFIRDPQHTHNLTNSAQVVTSVIGVSGYSAAAQQSTFSSIAAASTGIHTNDTTGGAGTDDVTASAGAHTHTVGAASPTTVNVTQPTLILNKQVKY